MARYGVAVLGLGGSDCEALRDGWLAQPANSLSSLAYVVAGVFVVYRSRHALPAAALIAVGIGSLLYHGPMPTGAVLAHDGSLAALLAAIALAAWWRRLRCPPAGALAAGTAAVTIYALSRTGAPLCRPEHPLQGHAAWHVLTAAALAMWLARPPRVGAETGGEPTVPHTAGRGRCRPGAPTARGRRSRVDAGAAPHLWFGAVEQCAECGFAWETVGRESIASRVDAGTAAIAELLAEHADRAAVRPSTERWSATEYAAHVRDVLLTLRDRLVVGLVEDIPSFTPMYRDERVDLGLYRSDTAGAVAGEMRSATAMFIRLFDAIDHAQLEREVLYGFPAPARRSLLWMGQQAVHEVEHHGRDIAENLGVVAG